MSELSQGPVVSEYPPAWQMEKLSEFTAYKAEIGEPSPHMAIVVHLTEGLPMAERLWRGACYLNAYSVGTAEKLWEAWPYERAAAAPVEMGEWIAANWAGFHTRTERRCVRSPAKFIRAQLDLVDWVRNAEVRLATTQPFDDPRDEYDSWWAEAEKVIFFGRYINIRLLEYVNRLRPGRGLDLYDIRAIGGWSPIRALTMFRPEQSAELLTGAEEPVNRIAEDVLRELRGMSGTKALSYYVFAAMLCEYREAYEDRHQYPGRTHDQELEYSTSTKFEHWDTAPHAIWDARRAIFPAVALGELSGWGGIRHDLSRTLRDHGYNWVDTRYDWAASDGRLAEPVRRLT